LDRFKAELDFVQQTLSAAGTGQASLDNATEAARKRFQTEGAVTVGAVEEWEAALAPHSAACKDHVLHCIGHAHIDMNWMWGFHETANVTLETFRTVLALMDRYPFFKFSQSQASVYRIVEQYGPQLVEPIRRRIAEGRWEVTAAQWVEADNNLPSGESLARQMLYARRFLMDRFGAPETAFELVFLPDTFGHHANTPELFADAGVSFLYHCRGSDDHHVYRWQAPSGRSILAYREPRWYNTEVSGEVGLFLPEFRKATGLKDALLVYGVGDHGGGPTMRDLERLDAMSRWPLYPTVRFGTLRDYFQTIKPAQDKLPLVRTERNLLFTGCYSSQARIKMANRKAQEALYEAELYRTLATVWRGPAKAETVFRENLRQSWLATLFSHFHDILPGSGVQLTREHALGTFQEALAGAQSAQMEALRRLSGDGLGPSADANALGAGVGWGEAGFRSSGAAQGGGGARLFHVYNALAWSRNVLAEVLLWDWQGDPHEIVCADTQGRSCAHQVVAGSEPYWGHTVVRLRVEVAVPAFGFAVLHVKSSGHRAEPKRFFPYGTDPWLVETPRPTVLENESVRLTLHPVTLGLVSVFDKVRQREVLAAGAHTGVFRLIQEDSLNMTAWLVGRHRSVDVLDRATLKSFRVGPGHLEQVLEYLVEVPAAPGVLPSTLLVRLTLERGVARWRYDVVCDWREVGRLGYDPPKSFSVHPENDPRTMGMVPQLSFSVSVATQPRAVRCDIPFGTIDRAAVDEDVPATSFAALLPQKATDPVVQLTTDSKQSFRFVGDSLSVALLRSSADPDPSPELGRHEFSLTLSLLPPEAGARPGLCQREALEVRHPVHALSVPAGAVSESMGFLRVEGAGVSVDAVKPAEEAGWTLGSGAVRSFVVRLHETEGKAATVKFSLPPAAGGPVLVGARTVDLHERAAGPAFKARDGVVEVPVAAHRIATIELEIAES
jgi:alpha-mannosidase